MLRLVDHQHPAAVAQLCDDLAGDLPVTPLPDAQLLRDQFVYPSHAGIGRGNRNAQRKAVALHVLAHRKGLSHPGVPVYHGHRPTQVRVCNRVRHGTADGSFHKIRLLRCDRFLFMDLCQLLYLRDDGVGRFIRPRKKAADQSTGNAQLRGNLHLLPAVLLHVLF